MSAPIKPKDPVSAAAERWIFVGHIALPGVGTPPGKRWLSSDRRTYVFSAVVYNPVKGWRYHMSVSVNNQPTVALPPDITASVLEDFGMQGSEEVPALLAVTRAVKHFYLYPTAS